MFIWKTVLVALGIFVLMLVSGLTAIAIKAIMAELKK